MVYSINCLAPLLRVILLFVSARDVAELPPGYNGRFVVAEAGEQQAAWPSAAWHVQGPALPPVSPIASVVSTITTCFVLSIQYCCGRGS